MLLKQAHTVLMISLAAAELKDLSVERVFIPAVSILLNIHNAKSCNRL